MAGEVDLNALAEDLRAAGWKIEMREGDYKVKHRTDPFHFFVGSMTHDVYSPCGRVPLDVASIIARHLTGQPAVPVDAIARFVAAERARQAFDASGWADGEQATLALAWERIQPTDCDAVEAWLAATEGVGE